MLGLKPLIAAGGAIVILAGVVWWQAGAISDLRMDLDQCRAAADTMERINDAISGPRDPADILDSLRRHAQ
jgi:hypothetical protein